MQKFNLTMINKIYKYKLDPNSDLFYIHLFSFINYQNCNLDINILTFNQPTIKWTDC